MRLNTYWTSLTINNRSLCECVFFFNLCPQSYIRSFRDRQSDRRSYSHSRMSRSRMAQLDYDCGSQVPLTAPSGPAVHIWAWDLHKSKHKHNQSLLQKLSCHKGCLTWPCRANVITCLVTQQELIALWQWYDLVFLFSQNSWKMDLFGLFHAHSAFLERLKAFLKNLN